MTFLSKGPLPPPPPPLLLLLLLLLLLILLCALLPHMSRPVGGAARHRSGLGRTGVWEAWVGPVLGMP